MHDLRKHAGFLNFLIHKTTFTLYPSLLARDTMYYIVLKPKINYALTAAWLLSKL
jgi:hypothetical protein